MRKLVCEPCDAVKIAAAKRCAAGGGEEWPRRRAHDSAQASGLDSIAGQLNSSQSVPWSIVLGLTLLTLLPALLLSMTPMVRLLVVFHFLRQALGTQTAPSNQVLMGLGLMMTWFLMQPVMLQVDQQALAPYRAGTISGEQALELGAAPVKTYMLRYRTGEGPCTLCFGGNDGAAEDGAGSADAGGRSGLHAERIESRLPDRRGAVSAVSAGRSGDREHYHFCRHDAVAAGGDFDAGEDPAVCDGGWMEPAGGFAAEEFLT